MEYKMINENLLRRIAYQGEHQTNAECILAERLLMLAKANKPEEEELAQCASCSHLAVCKYSEAICRRAASRGKIDCRNYFPKDP